jgi:uncharacterized protein
MHIRDNRAYQLCHGLYPLILQADHFIGEMDLDMRPAEMNMPQYDIHQYVNPRAYQKLRDQLFKSFKINLDQFSRLHPLMIMSIISTSVLESEHVISLDEHLWEYAKQHGKPTSGLESYEEQLKVLYSIEAGPLYKQLLDISRNPSSIRKHTDKSLELYINGQIHHLYKMSKASMQHLRKKVIYERNINMLSVIDHLDLSTQYFITVGAGHLSGRFGLLALLKKAGWKVRPVRTVSTV